MSTQDRIERTFKQHIRVNDGGYFAPFVTGIPEAARAIAALFPPPCAWVRYDDYHRSACGHVFEFAAGGPRDNDFVICPYCGGEIEEQDANQR